MYTYDINDTLICIYMHIIRQMKFFITTCHRLFQFAAHLKHVLMCQVSFKKYNVFPKKPTIEGLIACLIWTVYKNILIWNYMFPRSTPLWSNTCCSKELFFQKCCRCENYSFLELSSLKWDVFLKKWCYLAMDIYGSKPFCSRKTLGFIWMFIPVHPHLLWNDISGG